MGFSLTKIEYFCPKHKRELSFLKAHKSWACNHVEGNRATWSDERRRSCARVQSPYFFFVYLTFLGFLGGVGPLAWGGLVVPLRNVVGEWDGMPICHARCAAWSRCPESIHAFPTRWDSIQGRFLWCSLSRPWSVHNGWNGVIGGTAAVVVRLVVGSGVGSDWHSTITMRVHEIVSFVWVRIERLHFLRPRRLFEIC
jgi:hypothetical protein